VLGQVCCCCCCCCCCCSSSPPPPSSSSSSPTPASPPPPPSSSLVYSAFCYQTHMVFKAAALWAVRTWSLVDRCPCFGRICCLHLHVITVPPQGHNLINHHDKARCSVPVLTAPGTWLPVLLQL